MVIIFTQSYPFDAASEQTFLGRELPYLLEQFDNIILAPRICKGRRLELPPKVELNEGYAAFVKRNSMPLRLIGWALSSRHFLSEIRSCPGALFHPAKFLKLLFFATRAELTRAWLTEWSQAQSLDLNNCLLYSYWFDGITMGLGLVKETFPRVKVVSRAHGYDIYEELYFPHYWPLRRETLARLDGLFPASYDGRDYLRNHYPGFRDLIETAHLGIEAPGFVSQPSSDGIFRIVSCAHIVPLKRLDLLLDSIAFAARMRPSQKFEWIHFGDGKARATLQVRLDKEFPPNATGKLPGFVSNPEILQYYRATPVDVFVNLSTTEGGAPVSIMEAIACGIPIVATRVGGNPEIVSERNGILLNPDPTPEQVARTLLTIWDDPETARLMRVESRRIWQESYNADVNFRDFAERLKSLVKSK